MALALFLNQSDVQRSVIGQVTIGNKVYDLNLAIKSSASLDNALRQKVTKVAEGMFTVLQRQYKSEYHEDLDLTAVSLIYKNAPLRANRTRPAPAWNQIRFSSENRNELATWTFENRENVLELDAKIKNVSLIIPNNLGAIFQNLTMESAPFAIAAQLFLTQSANGIAINGGAINGVAMQNRRREELPETTLLPVNRVSDREPPVIKGRRERRANGFHNTIERIEQSSLPSFILSSSASSNSNNQ